MTRRLALIWLGATAVVSAIVGVISYGAGWAAGAASHVPAAATGGPYPYSYGPHFFGFFGFFPFLFLLLILFIVFRFAMRGGPWSWGGWGYRGYGPQPQPGAPTPPAGDPWQGWPQQPAPQQQPPAPQQQPPAPPEPDKPRQ